MISNPRIVFILAIAGSLLLLILILFGPNKQKTNSDKVEESKPTTEQIEVIPTEESKPRIWRGVDYNLPAGVIVGGEQLEGLPSSNWISIQQSDGHVVIIKNLEWQIYRALQKGDIIE